MAETNNLFMLVTPFIEQLQEIEYHLDDLRQKRQLLLATGAQLDGCGDILDVSRQSRSDNAFLAALQQKILFNITCGEPDTLIAYASSIVSGTNKYFEPYPATVRLQLTNMPSPIYVLSNIKKLAPAGVTLEVVVAGNDDLAFSFADEDGHVTTGHGFLELGYDETTGSYTAGKLAEAIQF